MDEELLTPTEIQAVLEEAKSTYWLDPNLMGLKRGKTSVLKVSAHTGLILICGNRDTGCNHIEYRHRFGRQVWEDDREKLNKASEIRYGVAPIDYIRIAESIYRPENLQERLSNFDKYQGAHVYKNGDEVGFLLLTYSGTGIIHTLYPLNSDNPRNKMFRYRQEPTTWKYSLGSGVCTYTIPYSNKAGNVIFKIVVRGLNRYPIERIYIEVNEGNTAPAQTIFIKELNSNRPIEHGPLRSMMIQDGNKMEIERTALQVIAGEFIPNKNEPLYVAPGRSPGSFPTFFSW